MNKKNIMIWSKAFYIFYQILSKLSSYLCIDLYFTCKDISKLATIRIIFTKNPIYAAKSKEYTLFIISSI